MKNEEHLKIAITELSISSAWSDVIKEWKFTHAFYKEDSACKCTKKGIKKVCVISNTINNNTAEVGNCCVNKFLGINDGNKYFKNIIKLVKNVKSHINNDFGWQLFDDGLITEDERCLLGKFNNINIKYHTGVEWAEKIKINTRILAHYSNPLPDAIQLSMI